MGSQNLEPIAIVGKRLSVPWRRLFSFGSVEIAGRPKRYGKHHGATNVRKSYLLQEDLRLFDTAFFNIRPNEGDSMDPQQRILLETVYDALEAGGHTVGGLRGSDTAVFIGTMGVDYNDTGIRDLNTVPTYFATGVNRAIISNRVSYFFDWHGPSMTIDTACSSSLIAVHQSVKALRTGESHVALAYGTQVILNPEMYVIESKLKMLSPTGRSRMWDADADGYARGEGMAAIVLKRLSDAIADGDHIECLIRHTGSNQDGYSNGITVPSTEAQAALIRQTYAQAGLNPERRAEDRPQFFEAHGTGTKAGDPKEAAAIYQFFGRYKSAGGTPLYVGSIKTVIGHLEGSAGLAGLLKASGSIQNGMIAPNLLFQHFNPDIEPFYKGLQVLTEVVPWPQLPAGVPRRASVNSFGFGGSNAHAILEEYRGPSGQSEAACNGKLSQDRTGEVNAKDLAWTLQSRRSQFPTELALSALNIEEFVSKIDAKLAPLAQNPNIAIRTKASSKAASPRPKISGVFTGQGAELIRSSAFVAERIDDLEQSLAALPPSDRPQWSLKAEIMANSNTSRIGEAALSQPLCTAIQVVLVDLLQSAGISFSAVVGHSSGEIAAAYAAGFFSADDAVRIAYYRGLHARLAGNASTGQSGAMVVVGTSWEDAQDLINLRTFKGRLAVAAHNSAASVTLSGDADAVAHAKRMFDDEKKFARALRSRARGRPSSPALKGPATQNIADVRPSAIPYNDVLSRGAHDVNAFSDALGFVWTHLGGQHVDFQSYTKLVSDQERRLKLVVGLPSYQWNHARLHWNESRRSKRLRGRKQATHEILGTILPESTPQDLRWSNVLKVSEVPWMEGHQLQGQTVFPAAGYIAMALEASKFLAADKQVKVFEVNDLAIPRAVTFEEEDTSGVETLVTLTDIRQHQNQYVTANFSCYSLPILSSGSEQEMDLIATATVKIVLGTPRVESLMAPQAEDYNLFPIDADRFYSTLEGLGYGYSGPFKTFSSMQRRLGYATRQVATYVSSGDDTSPYVFHPSTLDVAFHAAMLAYSSPGDERLWSLHVPTGIRSVRVNPALCSLLPASGTRLPIRASIDGTSTSFSGYVDLLSEDGEHSVVQIEDLSIKTFAPATEADDRVLFTHTKLDIAAPDGAAVAEGVRPTSLGKELAHACERMAYYYVRKWDSELSEDEWANGQPHYKYLHDWVKRTLDLAKKGQHPTLQKNWANDSAEEIYALMDQYPENLDVKMIRTVGEKIPPAVRNETTILEHLLQDNMLDDFYKLGSGFQRYNQFLASMMKQITHRYPHTKILEIGKYTPSMYFGAGTGGATKYVLKAMGDKMVSYTYTDISVGFFAKAAEIFKAYSDKMTFKVLDVEKSPSAQGYEHHSYDIVIASNVLHATESLHTTLVNTRKLLKPGGYLLLLEITNNKTIRTGLIWGTFAGWWLGVEDGHRPLVQASGIRHCARLAWPFSIMASQAVDDRVSFLHQPLSSLSPPIHNESLVILGNQSLQTARLAEELANNLRRFCGELTILDSLPTDEEALDLAPQSTFINLVDIDSPIFKDITSEGMGGLQGMFELSKHVLWITSGALIEQPYHMSSITFSRVVRRESGHLDVSDLQQSDVPKAISKHLLQLVALDEWETPIIGADGQEDQQRILWSKESEAFLDNGTLLLPRLVNNVEQNARLMALNVQSDSYLFLAVSKEDTTGRPLILLSTTNSAAMAPVATLEVPLDAKAYAKNPSEPSSRLLVTAASEILASSLLDRLSPGSSVLIHCSDKDRFLTAALSRRASRAAVKFAFTFDADDKSGTEESAWVSLSGRASNYGIRKSMPSVKPTHFLDLTAADNLGTSATYHTTSAVHWPSTGLVKVGVSSIDSTGLFSRDKTHLLVGLTGKIGQSIAKWLVANGAACHGSRASRGPVETTPFAVVTSGIRNFSEDENIKGPWFTNPFFSHCVIDAKVAELESDSSDKKSNIPAARQPVKATSREQALDILKECFATKLRVILQLGSQDIDYDAPLVDLGIDSIVAVEVRSWFLKEVRVDIPVLKVVGGAPTRSPGAPKPTPLPVSSLVVDLHGPPSEVSVSPAETPLLSAGPASSSATEASTRSGSPSEATRLSQKVSSKLQSYFPRPEPVAERKRPAKRFIKSVPISLGQSRFWFLQQLLDDQRTHNVAYYYHIKGNLDVGDMERAVRLVASRHEALRTCFVQDETDASQAYQKVLPSSPVRLICKKIDSEDDVASEYQSLRAHDLDMASGELLKLVLHTLSPSSHFLLMYHHHIIMDGIGLQVFLSDLEKAYKGESLGPAPKWYPDFSKAQRQAFENGEM
ncbi:uncharacterized protein Triagg1_8397 [Trichoderma aggressivum f. europaeum]|uniref:Polyketide synthase n=1 Tax=Trichoderma aggressivum f. europaeum TaxID=173218 RepID=A0AAE1IAE7_9HYPO|nr:hypothetical protein Triagg1_8397 [Trichoderma aggressivum f. europaeum]